MSEQRKTYPATHRSGTLSRIGNAVAITLLLVLMMSGAIGYIRPDLTDTDSIASDIVGVLVWLVSLLVGIMQLRRKS